MIIKLLKYTGKAIHAAKTYNTLQLFPFWRTLAATNKDDLSGDLKAGINVALLAFPQGMAYALIAGLPIQYGIYGSAVAAIIGTLFTNNRFITLGPTNATAVMMLSAFAGLGLGGAEMLIQIPLLIFLIGFFILLGAYFKIANLIQYISRSVITGYITAAAILIIANQIPRTLGLQMESRGGAFFETITHIVTSIGTVHWQTLALSLFTAALYILLNKKFRALPNVAICLVLISAASAFLIGPESQTGVQRLSGIDPSIDLLELPLPTLADLSLLASPALAIALLCIIEGISIGKSLAAKTGARLDTNQAVYSIGMANIACSIFQGMPASGSLTRSTLCAESDGKTPLASLYCGIIIAIGAFTVGPMTRYIPQCSLAVLVIAIGIALINKRTIKVVTHSTRSDAIVFGTTFICGLILPLDTAIYTGVACSIVLFLKKVARPEMIEYSFADDGQLAEKEPTAKPNQPGVSIVHVEGELFFGAADLFRDQMRRICEDPNLKIIILKMRNAYHMDATGAMALEELVRYINEKGRYLILSEVRSDMLKVLKNSDLYSYIEARNIFHFEAGNPTLSTAKALKRAKQHLGDCEAKVSIFVNPEKEIKESNDAR